MPRFIVWGLLTGSVVSMLAACAYQRPTGQWVAIKAPGVYFSGVEMSKDARDPGYPDVCVEAQDYIKTELSRRLPPNIKPLVFHVPEKPPRTDEWAAVFQMAITNCKLDVEQSGGLATFYLTLSVGVTLKDNDRTLLAYNMETYEQAQTETLSPSFEFTFEELVARTLMLFDGGRVWIPEQSR